MLSENISFERAVEAHPSSATRQGSHVYVIDDDLQLRRSLHFLLSTVGYVSWPFSCAADFLDNLSNLEPGPMLIDVRMPAIGGIELMKILVDRGIRWPMIVMTAHAEIPVAVQSIKLGATEFLEKPFEIETLEASLKSAMLQLYAVKRAAKVRETSHQLFDLLTPREIEVLMVLIDGRPNKVAADQLSLSVRTIEMHRANAFAKLKVKSLAEVIRLARDAGIALPQRNLS